MAPAEFLLLGLAAVLTACGVPEAPGGREALRRGQAETYDPYNYFSVTPRLADIGDYPPGSGGTYSESDEESEDDPRPAGSARGEWRRRLEDGLWRSFRLSQP